MNTTKERADIAIIDKPPKEALVNQEEALVYVVGRIISGNKRVAENGAGLVIERGLKLGVISSFGDLSAKLNSMNLEKDDRNGIGRQVFRAVNSRKTEFSRWIHEEVLVSRYEAWLKSTFGNDRFLRWQKEKQTANS